MSKIENIEETSSITANIIDEENGVQTFENVTGIRIKSADYRLLVLVDFAPLLGKIDGDIVLLTSEGEVAFNNIEGYYKLQRNEFSLIIKKDYEGWYKKA